MRNEQKMEKNFNFKKISLTIFISSLILSALVGIFIFIFGDFEETQSKILLTTLAIGYYSLTSLCCSSVNEKKSLKLVSATGITISIVGLIYTTLLIWDSTFIYSLSDWNKLRLLVTFIVLSFSFAQAYLILSIKTVQKIVNLVTLITATVIGLTALVALLLLFEVFDPLQDNYFRLLGTLAILNVLGTITTPILSKLTRNHTPEQPLQNDKTIPQP